VHRKSKKNDLDIHQENLGKKRGWSQYRSQRQLYKQGGRRGENGTIPNLEERGGLNHMVWIIKKSKKRKSLCHGGGGGIGPF